MSAKKAPERRRARELTPSSALLQQLASCPSVRRQLLEREEFEPDERAPDEEMDDEDDDGSPLYGRRRKPPTLALDELARLEDDFGVQLHDDVLTLLALRDPIARLFTGLHSLGSVAEAADQAVEESDKVVIATVYSDPLGELAHGEHGGAYLELAVPRGALSATIFVDDRELSVAEFLAERLDEAAEAGWFRVPAVRAPKPLVPAPSLVGILKEAVATKAQRVRHAKFGEGTTLALDSSADQPKASVKFDDGTTRTMLMRFLTEI